MPFHKPLVQAHKDMTEAHRRAIEAEDDSIQNAFDKVIARMEARAGAVEPPPSPAPSEPASPTARSASPLAADELQSSPAPAMPASPTEQSASQLQSEAAEGELQPNPSPYEPESPSESGVRIASSQYPGTLPTGSKNKASEWPVLGSPPLCKARIMSTPLECEDRRGKSQLADFTTRPIASPARRLEGSPLQRGLAVPRCKTEVQDQIVANPPVVPMAASQTALVVVDDEPAGNSGAGQLLAEYYSMLASCTTQVACAY
jgi:hypothetical protein